MSWDEFFETEKKKDYFKVLMDNVDREYREHTVYPPREELFTAFELTPPESVRCVILGQDPYHGKGQAHGLAFSVKPDIPVPKSLANIYKELHSELGTKIPDNGCLLKWACQGVLMLNTVLTVREHEAGSHRGMGWETFTDNAIRYINTFDRPIVFMLWGAPAQSKMKLLDNPRHLILTSAHPSPLSAYRGFFGCGHFASCNEFLKAHGESGIDWQIEDTKGGQLSFL